MNSHENTLFTDRCIFRKLQVGDEDCLEYLLCPEIQCTAGSYMLHKREDLTVHLQCIKGDTSWIVLDIRTSQVLGDIGIHSIVGNKN
jgi:hypothetical protein